jgi:hypothetical protein
MLFIQVINQTWYADEDKINLLRYKSSLFILKLLHYIDRVRPDVDSSAMHKPVERIYDTHWFLIFSFCVRNMQNPIILIFGSLKSNFKNTMLFYKTADWIVFDVDNLKFPNQYNPLPHFVIFFTIFDTINNSVTWKY